MIEALALGTMALFGLLVIGLVGGLLKLVFWVILLPLRLVGLFLKLLVGLLLLPVVLVAVVVGALGFGLIALLGLLLPLLPIILLGLGVRAIVKVVSRPAVASGA